MIEGMFFVLEGIDGAGTTTQTERLVSAMRKKGLPVHGTREPSDGPFGVMIRQVLRGRLVVSGASGVRAPGWSTMALLFAADRADHVDAEIIPNLLDGVSVVCDRYVASSLAYQSSAGTATPEEMNWIRTINARARTPDLTIVLDVPEEVAAARRAARSGARELYEDSAFQAQLGAFYRDLERHLPGERIVHIDGARDAETVHADVLDAVERVRHGTW